MGTGTRNWGGMWRIPTKAEWEELLNEDNCTWTWTTDYKGDGSNVAGVIVTSKKVGYTDKSIFLPATHSHGDRHLGHSSHHTQVPVPVTNQPSVWKLIHLRQTKKNIFFKKIRKFQIYGRLFALLTRRRLVISQIICTFACH